MHQVANHKGFYIIKEGGINIKEEKTKVNPNTKANATSHALLKCNAGGTTRHVLLKYNAQGTNRHIHLK